MATRSVRAASRIDLGILTDTVGRINSNDSACLKFFLCDDNPQERFSIFKEFTGFLTDLWILQYIRIFTAESPCRKERTPVDIVNEFR